MSLPVVYRRVAQAELDDAVDWHEAQSAGLGRRLAAAVELAEADIAANPYQFAEALPDAREAPVPGFRYALYYRILPSRVEIFCVFHTSRDPAVWQGRV